MLKSASSLLDLARTHEHGDLQGPRRSISCVQQRPQEGQTGYLQTVSAHGQSSFCDQERPGEGQTGYLQTPAAYKQSSSISLSLSAETADKEQKATDVQPTIWYIRGKVLYQSAHHMSIALSIQDSSYTGHGDAGLHELEVPEEGIATAAYALYYFRKCGISNIQWIFDNLKELEDDIDTKTEHKNDEDATVEYPEHASVAEVIKKMESLSGKCDMTNTLKKPNDRSKNEITFTNDDSKSDQLDHESNVASVIKELESLSNASVTTHTVATTQYQRKKESANYSTKTKHNRKNDTKLEHFAPDSSVTKVIKTIESHADVVKAEKKTQDQSNTESTKTDTNTEHKHKTDKAVEQYASKPNIAKVVKKSEPNSDKSAMNKVAKKTQDTSKKETATTDTKTEHKNKQFAKVEQNNKEIDDHSSSLTQTGKTKETGKNWQRNMPQTIQSDEQPLARLEDMYVYKAKKKQLTKQDLSIWRHSKPATEYVEDNQRSDRKAYPLYRFNFNKNSGARHSKVKLASKSGKKSKKCHIQLESHERKRLREAVDERENTHSIEANGQTDTAAATEAHLGQEPNANEIENVDDIEKVTGTEKIEQPNVEIKKKTKFHFTSCFRNNKKE